jgi:asparagine synthase (glutamine-hydrolysing)
MCGIAGTIELGSRRSADAAAIVRRMSGMLVHRGPDDEGILADGPVTFGFRRLQIIDLATGHQPIQNEDETIWVMFNGEIYNYVELREELEKKGHRFRTKSDTEVIVHAYESWGLDFVDRLSGMFAIALWDRNLSRVVLVRDRMGKKPFFYAERNGQLAFASELKAFLPWPHLDATIDPTALHDYLTFLYVPAPSSIFAGVKKLPPAHMLVADLKTGTTSLRRYWKYTPAPDRSKSLDWYAEELRDALSEAVRIRLRSDVPLGAFLSGGVDSTTLVGFMTRFSSDVRTFTMGFAESRFDERAEAESSAARLGVSSTSEVVDYDTFSPDELGKLVWYLDEPFADSSAVPAYLLCRMARKHVTVALSGDGADELFGGYTRYRNFQRLQRLGLVPGIVRNGAGALAGLVKKAALRRSPRVAELARQVQKAMDLSGQSEDDRILSLITYLDETAKDALYSRSFLSVVNGYSSRDRLREQFRSLDGGSESLPRFMARDVGTNMVDDGLVKTDRASMACSLEVRCPYLDLRVVELAARIPPEYKIHGGNRKIVLKKAAGEYLPPEIARRRKQGFELPFAAWFQREPWRSLLIDMLSASRLRRQGIFHPEAVIALRDRFLADPHALRQPVSAYQLRHRVWMLLVFQLWEEGFARARTAPGARVEVGASKQIAV